ncbi:MAG: putative inorganic polyphosphate/ATP-NAD kinase [Methanosaeta sp. PtaB.Bin039]|nr:MAG: putative inorganic polyphosphate/ATP-NAD kinase [Methanosaeta sp. PtaB.Bin039]OPY45322.1 MAG: putative inorganic polyphosphate/ATP-NAD kinase [Methanosaeta sp. PtaU1.Bin028]HOT06938.1 NAD(+)/NADH kinase [Methanotrichaceae archaeon]HQF17751.1 NAD(+)/NADH kinase [Methanotrichaceae archaeon]HQI91576.1 NAD(+)/NADH kinase [Methanotrichaceae archaeon]
MSCYPLPRRDTGVASIRIGFVSRREQEPVQLARRLIEGLKGKAEVLVEPELAATLEMRPTAVEEMDADLIVSIGGDGTILRTIHKMRDPLPILGINMGTVGFLVDVEPADAHDVLQDLIRSGFEVDERSRLAIEVDRLDLPPATNEVALITASPAKMLEFVITVNGSPLESLRADGMIFATSTGSTAYAMSAGGPIVDPDVNAVVLVPVAPFKLSSRPWVISGDSVIQVELKSQGKEALVVVDGQTTAHIDHNDVVVMRRAEKPARFVKARPKGFYEKVKSKLA